jgi:hypothetical protein
LRKLRRQRGFVLKKKQIGKSNIFRKRHALRAFVLRQKNLEFLKKLVKQLRQSSV